MGAVPLSGPVQKCLTGSYLQWQFENGSDITHACRCTGSEIHLSVTPLLLFDLSSRVGKVTCNLNVKMSCRQHSFKNSSVTKTDLYYGLLDYH